MNHYVLMADVIGSRETDQALTMREFKQLTSHVNQVHRASLLSPLTITLGDEFQGISKNLAKSIALLFALEEFIIERKFALKLRYVLVNGPIDTPINHDIAYGMLGDGLTHAREMLGTLKKDKSRFYIELPDKKRQHALNEAMYVCQEIIDAWDVEKDFYVVAKFLRHHDYKDVADELEKTRSQIWKREKTLNIRSYFALKSVITYLTHPA